MNLKLTKCSIVTCSINLHALNVVNAEPTHSETITQNTTSSIDDLIRLGLLKSESCNR